MTSRLLQMVGRSLENFWVERISVLLLMGKDNVVFLSVVLLIEWRH